MGTAILPALLLAAASMDSGGFSGGAELVSRGDYKRPSPPRRETPSYTAPSAAELERRIARDRAEAKSKAAQKRQKAARRRNR